MQRSLSPFFPRRERVSPITKIYVKTKKDSEFHLVIVIFRPDFTHLRYFPPQYLTKKPHNNTVVIFHHQFHVLWTIWGVCFTFKLTGGPKWVILKVHSVRAVAVLAQSHAPTYNSKVVFTTTGAAYNYSCKERKNDSWPHRRSTVPTAVVHGRLIRTYSSQRRTI